MGYTGMMSKTKSGHTCQSWNSQSPHKHSFAYLGDHNYCRNPNNEPGVWCYTTDSTKRWEMCDVQYCAENYATMEHDSHRGQMSLKTLPTEVFQEMESIARGAGCKRSCLICISQFACTDKMGKRIPRRCHSYNEGYDKTAQGEMEDFFLMSNVKGF